jgi:hypothetical protein
MPTFLRQLHMATHPLRRLLFLELDWEARVLDFPSYTDRATENDAIDRARRIRHQRRAQ